MANTTLYFNCDTKDGSYIKAELSSDERGIWIELVDRFGSGHDVVLDKSTAIKFAKTLRTEINKIQE